MRPRGVASLFNTAARLWLTAAGLSLLAPDRVRLDLWLPLHLALAGAVSTAICGNMLAFASTLTASPDPPAAGVRALFALVNAGALLIAVGYPAAEPAVVAAGGTAFVLAMALLAFFVRRAWRRGLNRRHRLPMVMYGAAIAAVLAGGTIGALLGSNAVGGIGWPALRRAHYTVNVLGWASLTIAGTLVTLLPTVLRVRMPAWRGAVTGGLLVAGVAILALGLAVRADAAAGAGAVVFAAGVLGVADLVARTLRVPRNWPPPVAAKHMVAGVAWFVGGALALAWNAVAGGGASVEAFLPVFLTAFVCGWILQVLLGAWLYLLPVGRPGPPQDRRLQFAAVELGANAQVAAGNAGLAALAIHVAGLAPAAVGAVGAALAIAAGAFALAKAWTYPWLARRPVAARRAAALWGPG